MVYTHGGGLNVWLVAVFVKTLILAKNEDTADTDTS